MSEPAGIKTLGLRYAGTCRECGASLLPGTSALYDKEHKQVICLPCFEALSQDQPRTPEHYELTGDVIDTSKADGAPVEVMPADGDVVESGTAGASARREFERRVAKRERRIRELHPKLGGLILALSNDPQSTTAWQRGAKGEELLGKRLDELADRGVRTLHDRHIRGSRANIDHIAISPAGVFVLDAKRYKGRPSLRIEGGILRPRTETLTVGGRKCNPLVDGMHKQLALVTAALEPGPVEVPITGMLVFIDADWPLIGGTFTTRGVKVLWPKKATELILQPGPLSESDIRELHGMLASGFPSA